MVLSLETRIKARQDLERMMDSVDQSLADGRRLDEFEPGMFSETMSMNRRLLQGAVGDRRAKRTHFGELIGVENGPTVAVSGSFESFWFKALETKDADGGRLRTDQACSS